MVLTHHFGNVVAFALESEVLPGVMRYYNSFSAAADEANEARVFGGMHFRTSVRDGRSTGEAVATFVVTNVAQPVHAARYGHNPAAITDGR